MFSDIEFCMKRTQRVYFHGSVGVKTHLDESRMVIWINLNDLIEDIALPLSEELEFLESEEGKEFAKGLGIHVQTMFDSKGMEYFNMFIPHYSLNDYLYSIQVEGLQADVIGNLRAYRQGFAVEVNAFWTEFSKSVASVDDLDLRRALWIRDKTKVGMISKRLSEANNVSEDVYKHRIQQFCFGLMGKPVCPTSSLNGKEFDFYRLAEACYVDACKNYLDNGGDPTNANRNVEDKLQMYFEQVFMALRA